MKITDLKLKNFRNIKDLFLAFDREKTLIIGKNAQGKTNILESIYLLSTLKSQRTYNNSDFIKFGETGLNITADIVKNTDISLGFALNGNKRSLLVNNLKSNPAEFKSVFKTVLFSSRDLMLLRGVPEDRRKWLDLAILQVYPTYADRLAKYNKIRMQKNNFLKDFSINKTLLDVYNEQLSILGSNIIFLRKKFLKELEGLTVNKHSKISENEHLSVKYVCNFLEDDDNTAEEILKKYKQKQAECYDVEIFKRQTLIGPHKDDISFYINNEDATKFASQGQQRTIVLALKLAELDMITDKIGDTPVLLLDDVLAELDDKRQNYLLKSIDSGIQTIITSVDTLLFDDDFLKKVQILKIDSGNLIS